MYVSREVAAIIRQLLLQRYPLLWWQLRKLRKLGDDTSRAELGSSSAPTAISTNLTPGRESTQVVRALIDIQPLPGAHPKAPQALGQPDFNRLEDT